MNNTNTRTTYRRVDLDGLGIVSTLPAGEASFYDFYNRQPAADYIERQWNENNHVVRYRTIRLGTSEKCDGGQPDEDNQQCNNGRIYLCDFFTTVCSVCNGSGVKSRATNPPWIEVKPLKETP